MAGPLPGRAFRQLVPGICRRWFTTEGAKSVIVLGVILILVGYLLPVPGIIATIGWILLAIGLVLLVLGRMGRPVGGRPYWY